VQYYAAARSAARAGLLPVCGNLYHHAIEALLKSPLSKRHSLTELKRHYAHDLLALWEAFKQEFSAEGLGGFDEAIINLQRFERLRYPDAVIEEGAAMMVGRFVDAPETDSNGAPRYQVAPPVVDHLVGKIFELCSKNPAFFIAGMNTYARELVTRDNPVSKQFMPYEGLA
jgi:hypothetical protein